MTTEKRCGFIALYGRGAAPCQVARWAGIRSDSDIVLGELSDPPLPVVAALSRIDELSAELPWTSNRDLQFLIDDQHLAYFVALDQTNKAMRLRAAIARAYAESDLLALAFVAEKQDLAKVKSLGMKLADAHEGLSHVGNISRWQSADEDVRATMRETIKEAETTLVAVQQMLPPMNSRRLKPGRREEDPKKFFVMRLAETYALLTGEAPIFHAPDESSARWLRFLRTAFEAVAYPTGTQGLDCALRTIGGMETHRWSIEQLAEHARAFQSGAAWSAENRWMRQPVQFGSLQSNGLLIDYKVPMPWAREVSTN